MGDNDLSRLEADVRVMNGSLTEMAKNMKELTAFMVEQASQAKANEEKFLRIHERIDANERESRDLEGSLLELTTRVIPAIQTEAAVKGSYWKIAAAISLPVATVVGSVLWAISTGSTSTDAKIAALITAVEALVKLNGG